MNSRPLPLVTEYFFMGQPVSEERERKNMSSSLKLNSSSTAATFSSFPS